ncbi:HAD-superfamily hydrolase, subfamily IA, variant 3:HAD-superfamily hydrolase, subfamily IA, variant 1 [Lachnospiraceae bacterium KM106-2]|nr:HAD-superfamily hydrolase, subfamily IA, variant 3:HAD-superfamily hydrolase, subfamily IA, variant 1 [Lachnospiraceae bacterium KM106-2]
MLKDIKACLFDLDGTLVDSMWMWKDIDIEYLGKHGIELPEDLQRSIEGMSFSETAMYFKERFQITESVDEIKATWNQMAMNKYANEVPLKEGVLEFLQYLKKKGIKTGIATSNSKELVSIVIDKHGIREYFNSIRTSCEVEKGKPAPDIYELVASDLEVDPSHCLVFEDVIQGIMAGKNAKMKVCAVADLYSEDVRKEKEELADYFIDSYKDIARI